MNQGIYGSVIEAIGQTPMFELTRCVPKGRGHRFFAKVEYFNPGGSVKDRIALAIIEDAEKRGKLKPGGTIVEATSGNTGVGLAMIAAVKGYSCVFVMPEKISEEKRATLRAYGARVVITPTGVAADDPRSHYSVARRFVELTPNSILANQYHTPVNRLQHYETTGPEIWEQTGGNIDVFVAGAGTGGTISGVGKFLKEKNPETKVVCSDPVGSILYDLFYHKEVRTPPKSYLVEGIGEDMLPDNVQFQYMDDFVQITDRESFHACREIALKEGLLVGPSCGSALAAAIKYSETLKKPSRIVVMFPDNGRGYLSKAFNEKWLIDNGLVDDHLGQTPVRKVGSQSHATEGKRGAKIEASATFGAAMASLSQAGAEEAFVYNGAELIGYVRLGEMTDLLLARRVTTGESVLHALRSDWTEVGPETPIAEVVSRLRAGAKIKVQGSEDIIGLMDVAAALAAANR